MGADHDEPTNGDRFNRQIKATAAYAEVTAALAGQNRLLFGDPETHTTGYLPDILASLNELKKNPLVRLGAIVDSTGKAAVALLSFMGLIAGIILAANQVVKWAGW